MSTATIIIIVCFSVSIAAATLPKPSTDHLAWLDQEIGTFFHYTMYTFVSQPNDVTKKHQDCGQVFNSRLKEMPHPNVFNPSNKTFVDQWMSASKAFGAKYILLVAKHCDGFVSFRTNATFADGTPYGYGVQQSTWRNGQGDLALDFVTSARKHGLIPGFYYSLSGNFYLSIKGANPIPQTTKGQRPVSQKEYFDIVYTQVQELWSNYGDLGEIWFDGQFPYTQNENLRKKIAEFTSRLQPHAILLQGPDLINGARKGSGETCEVHDPNWYTCPNSTACRHNIGGNGTFMPSEGEGCAVGDGNSRQWFWHPDHDAHAALKTVDMFIDEYHNSVGLGSNMLMGFTADRQGLVPSNDVEKVTRVGNWIAKCYGTPITTKTQVTITGPNDFFDLKVPKGQSIDRIWLREDIVSGQRVQAFHVFATHSLKGNSNKFVLVGNGTSVARKRIVLLDSSMDVDVVRFQVTKAIEWPVPMKEFAVFATCEKP